MSMKRLPRPRIQRAFVRWFNENYTRFMVSVRLTKITAKGVELHFHNYPDCLLVWLSNNEINVHVEWQGKYWDELIDLNAYPCHAPGGYKCKLCVQENGESATLFPNRESLWLDHLFEPFLKWVNEKLAPALWLQISYIGDRGATWAQLIRDEIALSEPDQTLHLMKQLKRLDGEPIYAGGTEGVTNLIISLKPETSSLKEARTHRGAQS